MTTTQLVVRSVARAAVRLFIAALFLAVIVVGLWAVEQQWPAAMFAALFALVLVIRHRIRNY